MTILFWASIILPAVIYPAWVIIRQRRILARRAALDEAAAASIAALRVDAHDLEPWQVEVLETLEQERYGKRPGRIERRFERLREAEMHDGWVARCAAEERRRG